MRLEDLTQQLTRNDEGIYVADRQARVSYAASGHAECFQVEDASFWFRHRNNCIASMVSNFPFSGPLLDIGGGNGYVAQRLAAEGHEIVLLEPGQAGARNARVMRRLEHVACATLEEASFRPGSFGAIGMFDVIEHIKDDRNFLASVVPLLAPDGRLYLTVPCHQWLWSQADVHAGHFRRHTAASLESLLDGMFEIDYLSYFFRPLVAPQLLLRALPHRMGLGRGQRVLSAETEHGSGNGIVVRAMSRLLEAEARTIAAGDSIGFGSSLVLAAHRT